MIQNSLFLTREDSTKKLATEINNAVTRALLGLLGIVFVTLKLTGVIAWSWWWVTLPFWGGLALVAGIFLLVVIFVLLKLAAGLTVDAIHSLKRKVRKNKQ